MAQYKVYDGTEWIDAAIQGKTGNIGPYYKPVLTEDGTLSVTPEEVTGQLEDIVLGNITGPMGQTGYGYNTNLLDNWDFMHPISRGSSETLYICDRWYRTVDDESFTSSLDSSGLKLTSATERNFIKQSMPYISPGKYIISVVSTNSNIDTFSFRVVAANNIEYTATKPTNTPYEFNQTSESIKYIHFGLVEVPVELFPSDSTYPSVQIGVMGSSITIQRAKFEVNIYRGEEVNMPTIAQEVFQNSSYNSFIIASSNKNGVYTSPFLSTTVQINTGDWKYRKDTGYYYATNVVIPEAIGNCHILVTTHPVSFIEWSENNIVCSKHYSDTGQLDFKAIAVPAKDVKANVLVVRY